jgi:UDP-glucose 4-epimerase
VILDDLSTGSRRNVAHLLGEKVRLIEGSVLDAEQVRACVADADVCVHLASPVGVRLIMERPLESLQRAVKGNDIVISAAAELRRPLLFTSSSEVYGKNHKGAVAETADTQLGALSSPRWWYAVAKAYGESLASAHVREHGAPIVIARLFNTVGPRQTGTYGMVVPRFVSQALRGDNLTVYGDGTQMRCFVHVKDTVDALIALLVAAPRLPAQDPGAHIFNIGHTEPVAIIDLARRVIDKLGSTSAIEFVPFSEVYGDDFDEPQSRRPDIGSVQRLTAWSPRRDLDVVIDDVAEHLRDQSASARSAAGAG